jgi:cation diffusion facilitator family transporter
MTTDTRTATNIRTVTVAGLVVNLALAAGKFAAGVAGHSQALVADAVHSLSDSFTDVAILVGSHFWLKPPDQSHPYGHRRIETLMTIGIGIVLMAAAAGIAWDAVVSLHHHRSKPPGGIALVMAAAAIVTKELIYRWTAATGKKLKSTALIANAWHHRTDALSSIPPIIAIAAAMINPSLAFLDKVGAIIVAVFILLAGVKILWPGVNEVVEVGASRESTDALRSIAASHPEVLQVHALRSRKISGSLHVDLHLVVDGAISVRAGHQIAEEVKAQLIDQGPEVADVVIHIEPPEVAQPALDNPRNEEAVQ